MKGLIGIRTNNNLDEFGIERLYQMMLKLIVNLV